MGSYNKWEKSLSLKIKKFKYEKIIYYVFVCYVNYYISLIYKEFNI